MRPDISEAKKGDSNDLHSLPEDRPSSVASVGPGKVTCAKCGQSAKDCQIVKRVTKFGVFYYWQWRHDNPIVDRRKKLPRYSYHYMRIPEEKIPKA